VKALCKGSEEDKKTQCTPSPDASRSLHQGVHQGVTLGTGSCTFGLFGFSASPPGTGGPWHGRGAQTHAEKQ